MKTWRATRRLMLAAALWASALACKSAPPGPAALDPRNDACRFCRMAVSDTRFAAQIVAPGEEPAFFDDLGCLTHFLRDGDVPAGAVVYVSDHAARAWIRADQAVFTRVDGLDTPMGSGLIAHRDAAAREADAVSRSGRPVPYADIVPASGGGAAR